MGPNGILVGKVINIMEKYKKFIGVNFCDGADILRAGIYPAYHEVSVITPGGEEKTCSEGDMEKVSIVGPLCENIHMVSDRDLPIIEKEDYIAIHDTGAHGIAMGMNYNGWGKSQELLMRSDNSVERIGRPQTIGDLLACETP
jgi:diaminopimelate decarboxylase